MRLINNNPEGYAELRNINLGIADIIHCDDIFSLGNKLKHKLTGKGYNVFYKGFFYSLGDHKTPCHLFNSINLGKNSWIVTFETILPRIGNAGIFWHNKGVKQLVKSNCKKIIALSQCTYERQIDYLAQNFPQFLDGIKKKMIVMHPPQTLLIDNYGEKQLSEKDLIFTFVGSDFFRKGGREILNVFKELIPLFPNLKLNIISSLLFGDYATHATEQDYLHALKIINTFPDQIKHYNGLPNNEVLEILKKSHVGLLPSWGDTYGYSVLEAQAAGCPVITTCLRAFPEINNNETGWILEVPLNKYKDGDIDTVEKRMRFQEILERELNRVILEILNSPEIIKKKGELSLIRIKEKHSIENYKKNLLKMYMLVF